MRCRQVTDAQMEMLRQTQGQYGVELRGSGDWAKARALVASGLGDIDGDPGQELPSMFWASEDGRSLLDDLSELEADHECPMCGFPSLGTSGCGNR